MKELKFIQFRYKNGNTYYKVELPCISCGKKRLVFKKDLTKPYFTNKCRSCSSKFNGMNSLFKDNKTNPNYNGGRATRRGGYIMVKLNEKDDFFDMADGHKYVLEHRLVYAKKIGRSLKPYEIIHHINNNKQNNRVENLELVSGLQNTAYYLFDKHIGII